jgi:hypothetical protein
LFSWVLSDYLPLSTFFAKRKQLKTINRAAQNPNKNPICGKKILVTCTSFPLLLAAFVYFYCPDNGKSTTVTAVDRCGGCEGAYDLDFSKAAFDDLADESVGRIHGIKWEFADASGSGGKAAKDTNGKGKDVKEKDGQGHDEHRQHSSP